LAGARIYSNTVILPGGWPGYGGGLHVSESTVTLSGGYLTGNTAEVGGGAWNWGTLTLVNTTVSGNSAEVGGGAWTTGTLTLVNTTVSGNRAEIDSGGIWNEGTLVLTYTTVAHNTSVGGSGGIGNQQDAYAQNTIVAHNDPYNCADDPLTSNGHNLEDVDECGLAGPGDLTDTDPMLDPLAEDRGTMVHSLQDDSPAIDAGFCLGGITTDQRGVDRPQGAAGKCDIGAYEFDTVFIHLPMVLRQS
jgi:hypothetical protein